MGGEEEGATLEFTPTWVVAVVCTVIVAISLAAERLLHFAGKYLKKKDQKSLFEALLKVKEELMLLGFISLLLTVIQTTIAKICVSEDVVRHMLPCALNETKTTTTTSHFQSFFSSFISRTSRRLLSEESSSEIGYCAKQKKVPLLSLEALHHLHIFIFVLAIVHVAFSVLTVLFGGAKIRQWKHWEDSIAKNNYDTEQVLKTKITHVHQHDFIKDHFLGIGRNSTLLGWLHSFFKQFYASVTKSDYMTLRLGFIMTHCRGNRKFNFHKYMIRALEDDFKKVVGISWYLWIFVVIFLLLNVNAYFLNPACQYSQEFSDVNEVWVGLKEVIKCLEPNVERQARAINEIKIFKERKGVFGERLTIVSIKNTQPGWHTYFWIAFIPFILLLAVGTKLEHVITQLAHDVAEKHIAIEGELVVQPSDDHFWFHRPRIVLFLIHFILFQNAFEIAFFFWIWVQYGFDSCIMGQVRYIVPRLIIGVFIQVLCSYSTLPLYAIVTQMGSYFKRAIFDEHVQAGLVGWAQKAKKKKGLKAASTGSGQGSSNDGSTVGIQLGKVLRKESTPEEIQHAPTSEEPK